MMVLRWTTLALALVHAFPASKHLSLFLERPSVDEGWKAGGAMLAIALYLAPTRLQARALASLWRSRRALLGALGFALAAVHLVPAVDHLPRFFASPSWADAWRGFGASFAVLWFTLPLPAQARLVACFRRACTPPPASSTPPAARPLYASR
jgi:hypothetical protein